MLSLLVFCKWKILHGEFSTTKQTSYPEYRNKKFPARCMGVPQLFLYNDSYAGFRYSFILIISEENHINYPIKATRVQRGPKIRKLE